MEVETGHKATTGRGRHDTNRFVDEELDLPENRLNIVFIGFMLSTFLAAMDSTIVTTVEGSP